MKAEEYLAIELSCTDKEARVIWNTIGRCIMMSLRDIEPVHFPGIMCIQLDRTHKITNYAFGRISCKLSPGAKMDIRQCLTTHFAQMNKELRENGGEESKLYPIEEAFKVRMANLADREDATS